MRGAIPHGAERRPTSGDPRAVRVQRVARDVRSERVLHLPTRTPCTSVAYRHQTRLYCEG
jgi:hypothetical protein